MTALAVSRQGKGGSSSGCVTVLAVSQQGRDLYQSCLRLHGTEGRAKTVKSVSRVSGPGFLSLLLVFRTPHLFFWLSSLSCFCSIRQGDKKADDDAPSPPVERCVEAEETALLRAAGSNQTAVLPGGVPSIITTRLICRGRATANRDTK